MNAPAGVARLIISSLSFSLNCRLCWWNNKSRPLWAALFSDNLRTIILVSSSIYQHLDAIVQNNAICILPGILFSKINPIYPDITIRPFDKPIFSSCNIVFAKSYTFTEADEVLITFLKTYLRSQQLYAKQIFL